MVLSPDSAQLELARRQFLEARARPEHMQQHVAMFQVREHLCPSRLLSKAQRLMPLHTDVRRTPIVARIVESGAHKRGTSKNDPSDWGAAMFRRGEIPHITVPKSATTLVYPWDRPQNLRPTDSLRGMRHRIQEESHVERRSQSRLRPLREREHLPHVSRRESGRPVLAVIYSPQTMNAVR